MKRRNILFPIIFICLVSIFLTACGNKATLNQKANVITPTPTLFPTSTPTPSLTPTPSPTPSPTPTPIPTNPFGETPVKGYKPNEKYEHLKMLELPDDFDFDAYYAYLIKKYGWTQDDYFYRHPDDFFEGTEDEFCEYWYRAKGIDEIRRNKNLKFKDKEGNPLYIEDYVVMKVKDGFCNHIYGIINNTNSKEINNITKVDISWIYWVDIKNGKPKYVYDTNDVNTVKDAYTEKYGAEASLQYTMDKIAKVYNDDMSAKLNGDEYKSNDFITRNVFCKPVKDGWYDLSNLEYAPIYGLK